MKKTTTPLTARDKLQQLNEARDLLDDLASRIAWAQDFSKFSSITQTLDSVGDAVSTALDEIDEAISDLEEALEEERTAVAVAVAEVRRESRVPHLLD